MPQVRWFLRPIGYAEAARAGRPEAERRRGRTMLDVVKEQGFSAIQALAGYVDFAVEGQELMHRTVVFAPPPHEKSMKMLKIPNGPDLQPQPWVPSQVAGYFSLYTDVLNAFDNIGPLFDALYSEDGKPGLWQDVLEGLRKQPNGPHLDLRGELVAHLGNRITILTDYQLPISTSSERLLFAIEAKDPERAAAGIAKWFKNDRLIRRNDYKNQAIWEAVPVEDKSPVPVVSLELPGFGPSGDKAEAPPVEYEETLLPNQAITVAHGHLLIASHRDFLVKLLDQAGKRDSLAKSVEYQQVAKGLAKFGAAEKSAENMAKSDELYRPTYELIRQGKMPESETMLGRILNTVSGAGRKGVLRKQQIDGTKMPDYELVRRSLGPAGLQAVTEEQGWFIKGFLMKK